MSLIHVAKGDSGLYQLKETAPAHFQWFLEGSPTPIEASNPQEAIRLANRAFALDHFEPLRCGTKFPLPERDEHGSPALYIDMIRSLASPNGQYYDPAYGHNFIVHQIPTQSRALSKTL